LLGGPSSPGLSPRQNQKAKKEPGICDLPDRSANASGLAGRYAVALFELAREQDALDAVAGDLGSFRELLEASADLRRLIHSPVLSREEQRRAITAVAAKGGAHDLTRRFLGLLAEKRRLFALPDVIDAYEAMLAAHRGEIKAEVISAVALTDEQRQTVERQLAEAAGQQVKIATAVEPGLLGGLIIRIGSRMIDASLRSKLHQLELAMKGAV
jgi:F-type H+-transporting ATPase subunit delta